VGKGGGEKNEEKLRVSKKRTRGCSWTGELGSVRRNLNSGESGGETVGARGGGGSTGNLHDHAAKREQHRRQREISIKKRERELKTWESGVVGG